MSWFSVSENGIHLHLQVVPGAKKTEVIGPHGDSLKIKIHAPPVDGKANEEVVRFLSELFDISKSKIQMISGMTSRKKKVFVSGIQETDLQKLNPVH